MANVEIHDLITAENISASDVISEQRNDGGTWLTRKLTFNNLGLFLNRILNYATALNTTDKTIIGAINEILQSAGGGIELTDTLEAGETSLTFTNSAILTTSTFDFYTDIWGVNPTAVSVISGQLVLTFDEQVSDVSVKVVIK